jgi:hypothetical protein
VDHATAEAEISALSGSQPGLRAQVSTDLTGPNEAYEFTVHTAREHRLVEVAADFEPEPRRLTTRWTASVPPGVLAAFARGRPLPELDLESTGEADLALDAQRLKVRATGRLAGRDWADLDPRLSEIDDLVAEGVVVATGIGGRVDTEELRLVLIRAGDRPLLTLEALQPVSTDSADWSVTPETWGEPTFRMRAQGFPFGGLEASIPPSSSRADRSARPSTSSRWRRDAPGSRPSNRFGSPIWSSTPGTHRPRRSPWTSRSIQR